MAKRALPKKHFYRCARCATLIPRGYNRCSICGYDHGQVQQLIEDAKAMFPGSREL